MKIPSKLFASLDRIDYIKCDIEGFEYLVLENMKEIIRFHRPKVQVEVWSQNENYIMDLFNELQYIPYKLNKNKLLAKKEWATKIEGDYIFIPKE